MDETLPRDEGVVRDLWERQSFQAAALLDIELAVVFRGRPSDAGGPDYQEALLADSHGALMHGDVEFHLRSSDWYRHGHDRDHRYDGVVLHVVWVDDAGATVRADGQLVPTVSLAGYATNTTPPPALRLLPHPCVARYRARAPEDLDERLTAAAHARFQELRERFREQLEHIEAEQVLYAGLMEGMGYASNRQAFRELAEAVPIAWLTGVPPEQRLPALLDAAGLGPRCGQDIPGRIPPQSWASRVCVRRTTPRFDWQEWSH